MAHAKTTPFQILAQLAIGASLGGIVWYSLRGETHPAQPKFVEEKTDQSSDPAAALDAAARATTTGRIWSGEIQSSSPDSNDPHRPK